jgi:heme/copper-type cytochrome/quinol oxidase subunit 3
MTEFAVQPKDANVLDPESRELAWSNVITGAHLWASATGFFFIGFVFAYFYLRTIDASSVWRPNGVNPSVTLGTLGTATLVGAAVMLRIGLGQQRRGHRAQWRREGTLALALLVATIALQIAEWSAQSFGPTQGAYASVFIGWSGVLFAFVIGSTYWVETVLATAIRYRKIPDGGLPPAGHASGDVGQMAHDISDPLSLVRPQLTAVTFYLQVLAAIGVLTWIILYLL